MSKGLCTMYILRLHFREEGVGGQGYLLHLVKERGGRGSKIALFVRT